MARRFSLLNTVLPGFSALRGVSLAAAVAPVERDYSTLRTGFALVSATADAALAWRDGSALRAGVLSSCFAKKKVAKEEGDPRVGAGFAGPLRYSKPAGAAELGPAGLKQSSPSFRRFLRCSAPLMGTPKTSRNDGSAQEQKMPLFSGRPLETGQNRSLRFGGDAFRVPLGGAEQRRLAGGFRLASVRAAGEFSKPPGQPSSARDRAQPGADPGVAFFLATFSWRSKKKYARAASAEPNGSANAASGLASTKPNRQTRTTLPVAATNNGNQPQKAKQC